MYRCHWPCEPRTFRATLCRAVSIPASYSNGIGSSRAMATQSRSFDSQLPLAWNITSTSAGALDWPWEGPLWSVALQFCTPAWARPRSAFGDSDMRTALWVLVLAAGGILLVSDARQAAASEEDAPGAARFARIDSTLLESLVSAK